MLLGTLIAVSHLAKRAQPPFIGIDIEGYIRIHTVEGGVETKRIQLESTLRSHNPIAFTTIHVGSPRLLHKHRDSTFETNETSAELFNIVAAVLSASFVHIKFLEGGCGYSFDFGIIEQINHTRHVIDSGIQQCATAGFIPLNEMGSGVTINIGTATTTVVACFYIVDVAKCIRLDEMFGCPSFLGEDGCHLD